MQNKIMMKKKLLYYEKDKFNEFIISLQAANDNIYPISYLINQNIALKYTGIDGAEYFVIDITTMVLSAIARSDLRIIYEGWINSLNEINDEKIDYCVEKTFLHEACDLFSYYFEIDEEIEYMAEEVEEEHKEELEDEKDRNSIVDYQRDKFESIIEGINEQLYGHRKFKESLQKELEAFVLLHRMQRKKIFSMLLCGQSGVGKTEVGRILQREMYPNELPIKINFGNYSGKGSLWSLIGSPKGYVGSEQGGELTNKIEHSKSKIIIIDELDKADETIFTFFYEMLEDGQYTDLDGKVIDLDGYIVVFTANLNNLNFKEMIPEPLFSRFDMTYEFKPLSSDDKMQFVSDYIDKLIEDYIKHVGKLDKVDIKERIIQMKFHNQNNLRDIKHNIMNKFVDLVRGNSAWNEPLSDNEE